MEEVTLGIKHAKSDGIARFGNARLNNGIQQRVDNRKTHSGFTRAGCAGLNAMGSYDFRNSRSAALHGAHQ